MFGKADEYTVEKWVKSWYEVYSKPNLRESTQERYWNHIQYHIVPEIGNIKLTKLQGRDIQIMYNNVRDHGRVNPTEENRQRTQRLIHPQSAPNAEAMPAAGGSRSISFPTIPVRTASSPKLRRKK